MSLFGWRRQKLLTWSRKLADFRHGQTDLAMVTRRSHGLPELPDARASVYCSYMSGRLLGILVLSASFPYAGAVRTAGTCPTKNARSAQCGCCKGQECHCCCSKGTAANSQSAPEPLSVCGCDTEPPATISYSRMDLPRFKELSFQLALDVRNSATISSILAESWARAHSPPMQLGDLSTLVLLI